MKPITTQKLVERYLRGRTIVAVELQPFERRQDQSDEMKALGASRSSIAEHKRSVREAGVTYDPVLVLDDGARVLLRVDETEVGEYGVTLLRVKS